MDDKHELEERKKRFRKFIFENKKTGGPLLVLLFMMIVGYFIRVKNLVYLKDATTNKFIPLALDPFVFLRYAKEVLTQGSLSAIDMARYSPVGYEQIGEFGVLSHTIVWLYKFLHFFNPAVTLEYAHVLYPPVFFSLSLVFFYLLVKRLFNTPVGLLATAFLVVLPTYIYRTMAGFSDKESLAMFFMFAVMYFYVRAWQEKRLRTALLFALISGVTTALMGLTWGGVSFIFLIFGLFALIEVVLDKFTEKDFFVYSVWLFSMLIPLMFFFGQRYTVSMLITSITSGFMFLAFLVGLITLVIKKYNIFKLKDKLHEKIPLGIFSLVASSFLGVIVITLFEGFGAISGKISSFVTNLLEPFGFTRWNLTVAESHQPYVADWMAQMGQLYVFLFLIGSIFLVYTLVKKLKIRLYATGFYTLFLFAFVFSRYKAGTKLDGVSSFSKTLYMGSLIVFFLASLILYLYAYKKDKTLYEHLLNFDNKLIFVLIWFLVLIVAARSAIRLLHIFSPVTTVLAAYSFYFVYDKAKRLITNKHVRYAVYGVLILFLILPNVHGTVYNFYKISSSQASVTGPSYNQQWQAAMSWVRENTPEDAVFAHWWDYGYWVQTGGERATLTDGGNAGGYALNYFMGRHVLLAQNEREALEYLYARNATHLLMIRDEIGKYPAYSSIGSDVNYDRYSYIATFQLDNTQIQERRDDTLLFYPGGYAFDEDFIYNDIVFPAGSSGIGALRIPVVPGENNSFTFKQPEALVVYAGQQHVIPLECLYYEGKELTFETEGLKGCFRLIPRVSQDPSTGQQRVEPFGAGLYLSERVRRTLVSQLFVYGKQSEYFKIAYNDEGSMPLAVYNGQLIGPLKIWEINYPDDLDPSPYYYGNELPDQDVTKARK